jgi:adenylate cyclase
LVEARDKRRLAAIFAADIVGYSRLMAADESGTLARLKSLRGEVIDQCITDHGGRLVKTTGDGFLAEFASVVDAVTCAVGVQQAMAGREPELAEEARMRLRIGVNLGDIIAEGDDIFGDGVNVAARLESLAPAGGICISRAARDQVRDRLPHALSDMGEVEVKNIPRPVRVFRVDWGESAAAPKTPKPEAAPPDKPSIVVLPFDNMSGDPEQEYFSDGITEDIITDLSKVSGLLVIARNSAFTYKGKSFNVSDVCREFAVKFALEGSIRKAGQRVRITAQLIEGKSGMHLWAERYDRELTDIFAVQDDVTQAIVAALKVNLTESEKSRIAAGGTDNMDAHDLFLRGRDALYGKGRNREGFERACGWFNQAIALDANYAPPYAGLAGAYLLNHQNHWSEAPEASLSEAQRLCRKAIALNDKDPYAHYVASVVAMFAKELEYAASEAEIALTLSPNFALALNARGIAHAYMGEPEKGIPLIERAIRLDPVFQQQAVHFLATAHFIAGDYATAASLFRDRIAINPETDLSRAFLCAMLGHLGETEEAARVWRELMAINPTYDAEAHAARLPFADPRHAENFLTGLRLAGVID